MKDVVWVSCTLGTKNTSGVNESCARPTGTAAAETAAVFRFFPVFN